MTGVEGLALARVLHVLGVVVWIGGVWMATTVALPAVRRGALGPDRLAAFQAIERRCGMASSVRSRARSAAPR